MKDLGLLSSFAEAADCGSFTEAARRLLLTPSTVSRNIARLEVDLGVRLFNRTTRALHLTEEGKVYLESVKAAMGLLNESEARLLASGSEPSGVLRVAMPVPFGVTYILPRLREFLDAHERISLDINFEDNPVDPVRDGFDLVIRNAAPMDGTHIIRKLVEEHLILVASPEYLIAHGAPQHPQDLVDHLCIAHKAESSQTLPWKWRPKEESYGDDRRSLLYDPNTRLRVFGHSLSGINAAVAGLGISVVSHVHVRSLLEQDKLEIVLPDFKFVDETELSKIYAVYPDRKFLPSKVRTFLDFVTDAIQKEEKALLNIVLDKVDSEKVKDFWSSE